MKMTKLPLHSRVALKDGADNVYVYALAGTEGWVRGHKVDDEGFDLVKIEWDKTHWRFNGQPDGWTFASHFYVVGPPSPPEHKEEEKEDDMKLPEMPASEDEMDEYMDTLTEAMDAASESEGFVVFTIRRVPNPDNPSEIMFIPGLFTHSVSKEAGMLLDIQLAEAASTSYQELIIQMMQAIKSDHSSE